MTEMGQHEAHYTKDKNSKTILWDTHFSTELSFLIWQRKPTNSGREERAQSLCHSKTHFFPDDRRNHLPLYVHKKRMSNSCRKISNTSIPPLCGAQGLYPIS